MWLIWIECVLPIEKSADNVNLFSRVRPGPLLKFHLGCILNALWQIACFWAKSDGFWCAFYAVKGILRFLVTYYSPFFLKTFCDAGKICAMCYSTESCVSWRMKFELLPCKCLACTRLDLVCREISDCFGTCSNIDRFSVQIRIF